MDCKVEWTYCNFLLEEILESHTHASRHLRQKERIDTMVQHWNQPLQNYDWWDRAGKSIGSAVRGLDASGNVLAKLGSVVDEAEAAGITTVSSDG